MARDQNNMKDGVIILWYEQQVTGERMTVG